MIVSYKGITALITGASMGIGEHFARELAKRGAHLILVARSREKLEKLSNELKQTYGIQTHVFVADLSLAEAPRRLYEDVLREKLCVELLVNNAGFGYCGDFDNTLTENIQNMIQVNVAALTVLTHLFLPGMLEKKNGGMINVASTAGYQPLPRLTVYAATKAFVLGLTEALWAEYQNRGVRFFCLCPGNTESNFHDTAGVKKQYRFFRAKAEEVVSFGLDQFLYTNHPSAIYGWMNRVLAFAPRLAPRSLTVRVASLIYRSGKTFK